MLRLPAKTPHPATELDSRAFKSLHFGSKGNPLLVTRPSDIQPVLEVPVVVAIVQKPFVENFISDGECKGNVQVMCKYFVLKFMSVSRLQTINQCKQAVFRFCRLLLRTNLGGKPEICHKSFINLEKGWQEAAILKLWQTQ